ncbi:MAG TPA: site-2 protease family protein [Kofleriaceae bacterium]
MFSSWRLGRVLGFPVEINLSFLLLLAVVYLAFGGLEGVQVVGLAFASVLVHELGHALVARRLGVHVSGIELSFFGGAAKMVQMPRSADHEIAIAAAGPAVSLMLAGAGFGLGVVLHSPLLWQIGGVNLVIAGFNLIPALPMDGGRILRALLTRRMDFVRATDIAVGIARAVAIGFGIFGLILPSYQLLALAPLLWMMGTRERMLARAMADQYVRHGRGFGGDDRFGRTAGPYGSPGFGGGWRGGYHGPAVRRYTVRQVGGRLVIETLDGTPR